MLAPFIGIMGATAVGKSQLAIRLAQLYNGEVVSCDSMQIYRGLDIGTAKITPCETCGIVHHMIDVVAPEENFSTYDYCSMTNDIIRDIIRRGKLPIVVGGTGLYFSSLLYGLDNASNNETLTTRQEMNDIYQSDGLDAIVNILKNIDETAYKCIDLKNAKRVIRAIEIASNGGSIVSETKRETIRKCALFTLLRNRENIYANINIRVDKMIEAGLVNEVTLLHNSIGNGCQSMQAIGYKEIIAYLDGNCSLDEAIYNIKLNSRHYAKRQLTYFKRLPTDTINMDAELDIDAMCHEMMLKYNSVLQEI